MKTTIERALSSWRSQKELHLRPGLQSEAMATLCGSKGFALPAQMRELVAAIDGFDASGDQDERGFSFWPLAQMERVDRFDGGAHCFEGSHEYLLFCDYLGWSWAYAIRIEGEAAHVGEVVLVGSASKRPIKVASTLEKFLEEYLEDGAALYETE